MATKNTALRNLIANALGTAMNAGTLELLDGATVLAEIDLDADAFGAASTGTITALGVPIAALGLDDGVVDSATLKGPGGTLVCSGLTVGVGTGQVQLSSLTIATDQTVNLTSLTWTVPAETE
jgi:hypothetical protein